jgi:hypothetical protein
MRHQFCCIDKLIQLHKTLQPASNITRRSDPLCEALNKGINESWRMMAVGRGKLRHQPARSLQPATRQVQASRGHVHGKGTRYVTKAAFSLAVRPSVLWAARATTSSLSQPLSLP